MPLRLLFLLLLLAVLTPAAAAPDRDAARVRSGFMRLFERPRVPLDPTRPTGEVKDGLLTERLNIASEKGVRVPLLVVRTASDASPRPAVICLHGLGGNKEGMRSYLETFARRGYLAVALDHRYHGDRAGDLQAAMIEAFRTGKEHPYVFDTVWDVWRLVDYLQTRPDVDRERIGMMGISLGGHATWMASADPRIKVAVPCISVCSWQWAIDHEGYKRRVANVQRAFDGICREMGEPAVTPKVVAAAWDRLLPGIPAKYDCQDVLAAMAPRPLLILNGETDDVAPIEGVRVAYAKIEAAYDKAGAADHVKLIVAPNSGHTVTQEHQDAMYGWFDRWLKNGSL